MDAPFPSVSARSVIAIVDDDARVLESLTELLESAGHRVRVFLSAAALLGDEHFPQVRCVIADVVMPEIDGLQLRFALRCRRPELPVILMTGQHDYVERQPESLRAGLFIHPKPFDPTHLLRAVESALLAA